jgi:hypothetical protein
MIKMIKKVLGIAAAGSLVALALTGCSAESTGTGLIGVSMPTQS